MQRDSIGLVFALALTLTAAAGAQVPRRGVIVGQPPTLAQLDDATPPTNITATPTLTTVTLAWPAVAGATSYSVIRAPSANGQYGSLTPAPITATQFSDSGLVPGTAYFYRVSAARPDGHYGTSEPVAVTTPAPNPGNFVAKAGPGGAVMLTWDAVPGASYYWIASGPGIVSQKLSTTSFTVQNVPSGTHTYALIAYYETPSGTGADEANPARATVIVDAPSAVPQAQAQERVAPGAVLQRRQPGIKIVDNRIRGFADLHNHQFANLGFGGLAFWGQPFGPPAQALQWCTPAHGPGGTQDFTGNLMRSVAYGHGFAAGLGHLVGGDGQYDGWPRWNSITHQSVYEDWLKRAHDGGLQLMVMLAVNNSFLCSKVNRAQGRTCDDGEAIGRQLGAARNMEAYIDGKAGGAGQGWYRIVTTPAAARTAIGRGQLAVVLGIEVDDVFRCTTNDCVGAAISKVGEYYDQGVRHIFPVHFKNNSLAGAAFDKTVLQGATNVFASNPIRSEVERAKPYQFEIEQCGQKGYRFWAEADPNAGFCNKRGLTNAGRGFIGEMMHRGMIVDVDHLSDHSFAAALDIAEQVHVPVVSGHSGFTEISRGDKAHEGQLTPERVERVRRSGGLVAVIPNQGSREDIVTWQGPGQPVVAHTCGHSSESFAQAYLYAVSKMQGGAVALGTDFNGYAGLPAPRTGPEACMGDQAGPPKPAVAYPFTALANGAVMNRSVIGQRPFDITSDGLAHVGMLPDLVADLQVIGVGPTQLEPLLNSAEAYIAVWERAIGAAAPTPEDSQCAAKRQQIAGVRHQISQVGAGTGAEQKACQAEGGKPNQCRDLEAERADAQEKARLQVQLNSLLAQKAQLRCIE